MKQHLDRLAASKLLRFGAVGGAGFFVNEAALFFAKAVLHLGDHPAWLFGFAAAVTFTWWGNRTFTFHEHKSRSIVAEWARFVATNSLGALANYAVYALLVEFAPWPVNVPYAALFFGVVVGMAFNFTLSKKLVFRPHKEA